MPVEMPQLKNLAMEQNRPLSTLRHPIVMLNFLDLLYLNFLWLFSLEWCNQVLESDPSGTIHQLYNHDVLCNSW